MKRGKWRIAVTVLAASVLFASITTAALAKTSRSQSAPGSAMNQEFLSALASNLNISQDTLTAAVYGAEQQVVSEQVYQGKLTQAQADKIESQPNFGKLEFHFFGGPGPGFHRGPGPNFDQIAAVLGISSSQLATDMRSGKTLEQIVVAQGMTVAQFKQDIAQEVSSGKLTQDQANRILNQLDHPFRGPHGGHRGGPPPQQNSNSSSTQSS